MKVEGLDIDFDLELAKVQFPNAIQFGGASQTSASSGPEVKIYADFESELVLLHHTRKGEQALIPFSAITVMKPVPKEAAALPQPPVEPPKNSAPHPKLPIADVDESPMPTHPHPKPGPAAPYGGAKK